MSNYTILITKTVQKQLQKLPGDLADKLEARMLTLEINPRPPGCKKLSNVNAYRIRTGNYRIIYEIRDDILIVVVIKTGHRKDVYRD